jgi:hypothetical protein
MGERRLCEVDTIQCPFHVSTPQKPLVDLARGIGAATGIGPAYKHVPVDHQRGRRLSTQQS